MCVAPAEPLRDRTAEFTLEFYEVSSVLGAVLDTCSYADGRALTTDKILWLILLPLLLCLNTIFETSKISLLAFETLIICELKHGVFLEIVVVWTARVLILWELINFFMLSTIERFLFDVVLYLLNFT